MIALAQARFSREDLGGRILRTGRIVLASAEYAQSLSEHAFLGSPARVLDGNLETGTVLAFHGGGNSAPYLLVDVGLSHDPPARTPRPRRPASLLLYPGPCTACSVARFSRYGRPRDIRLELYARQANNPDRDFRHEPPLLVHGWQVVLADRPGPQAVSIQVAAPPTSSGYPHNVSYYSMKIIVLSVYPGGEFPGSVAFSEVVYGDADPAVSVRAPIRYWK